MSLTDAAMEPNAAEKLRVHDDAVTGVDAGLASGVHHFAGSLVTHDQRVTHGNSAVENLQVGAANAGMGDANQHLSGAEFGNGDVIGGKFARRAQNHGFHAPSLPKKAEMSELIMSFMSAGSK